jgi:hypothetical protein
MRRVINQEDHLDWPIKVSNIIKSNYVALAKFQKEYLGETDLHQYEKDIKRLYDSFKPIIHPVATAKVLYLLCPNFFPIWDNAISDGVRSEIINKFPDIKTARLSSDDYYRYMLGIQKFLDEHDNICTLLAKKYRKGKLRILDECFWWGVRRPFCLLFETKAK